MANIVSTTTMSFPSTMALHEPPSNIISEVHVHAVIHNIFQSVIPPDVDFKCDIVAPT